MAEVRTNSSGFSADFAYYLEYLENRFTELEEAAQDWEQLDAEDKNDLLLEWPLVEDRLSILRRLSAEPGVPHQFESRYYNLLSRVMRDRPLLDILQS